MAAFVAMDAAAVPVLVRVTPDAQRAWLAPWTALTEPVTPAAPAVADDVSEVALTPTVGPIGPTLAPERMRPRPRR